MNLEEIISAAVEKRVAEIVAECVNGRPNEFRSPTAVELAVRNLIDKTVREEIGNHSETVRSAIQKTISELPTSLTINAYTEIKYPKEQPYPNE